MSEVYKLPKLRTRRRGSDTRKDVDWPFEVIERNKYMSKAVTVKTFNQGRHIQVLAPGLTVHMQPEAALALADSLVDAVEQAAVDRQEYEARRSAWAA